MKKGSSLEYVVLVEFREKRTVLLASSSGSSSSRCHPTQQVDAFLHT